MTYTVSITDEAAMDLDGIFKYIDIQLNAPVNAGKQLQALETRIKSLEFFPNRFPRCKRKPWSSMGVRFAVVGRYLVFFLPNEGVQTVTVVRVMYGGSKETSRFI
jgi:plasmid stabilization system protein ParE